MKQSLRSLMVKTMVLMGLFFSFSLPQITSWAGDGDPIEGKDNEPPSTVPYLVGLGYASWGEHEKAIAAFTQAITLEPDFDEAIFARGDSYTALGQYEQALDDYAQVMVLMPRYGRPYYQRALLYLTLGQVDKAVADLEVAVKWMKVVPEPHLLLGDLYYERGEQAKALVMYTRYMELAGDGAEAYVAARVGVLVALRP